MSICKGPDHLPAIYEPNKQSAKNPIPTCPLPENSQRANARNARNWEVGQIFALLLNDRSHCVSSIVVMSQMYSTANASRYVGKLSTYLSYSVENVRF